METTKESTKGTTEAGTQKDQEQFTLPQPQSAQPSFMANARRLFHNKSAVIRHVLKQIPEGERIVAREIAERCEALIRKLPEDMQQALLPIKEATVANVRGIERAKASVPETAPVAPPPAKVKYGPRKGTPLIRWSEWEMDQLAVKIVELRLNNPYPSILEICREAQKILPEPRQRTIRFEKDIKSLLLKVADKLSEVKGLIKKGVEARDNHTLIPPIPTSVSVPVPEPLPAPPEPLTLEETLLELTDEALLDILRERRIPYATLLPQMMELLLERWRVTDDVLRYMKSHEEKMDSILDYLTQPRQPIIPPQVIPPATVRVETTKVPAGKKPRYLIVSLRRDQQERVLRACGHLVDLRFSDMDEQTPPVGPSIDYVVLPTKFTNHGVENYLRAHTSKERLVRVPGGIEEMINTITKLAKNLPLPYYGEQNGK